MLVHFNFYVLALFQPGTSEVKCSETQFWKDFFSCLSYLRTESLSVSMNKIHGFMDLRSQLQTSNNLSSCKVGMISLKPSEGMGTDMNFTNSFCKQWPKTQTCARKFIIPFWFVCISHSSKENISMQRTFGYF